MRCINCWPSGYFLARPKLDIINPISHTGVQHINTNNLKNRDQNEYRANWLVKVAIGSLELVYILITSRQHNCELPKLKQMAAKFDKHPPWAISSSRSESVAEIVCVCVCYLCVSVPESE